MLAILSAPGSRGDVNPMIGIGRALKQLGFDVVISLAGPYASVASQAGLHPEVVIESDRFEALLADARFWKPIRGVRLILIHLVDSFFQAHEQVIRKHFRPGETILVTHPLDLASGLFCDEHPEVPIVDIQLSPVMLRITERPPRLHAWGWTQRLPAPLMAGCYRTIDAVFIDPVVGPTVNRRRAELGLPRQPHPLERWWRLPNRTLAMYPAWFAPETVGYSAHLEHLGFPLDDADDSAVAMPADRPIVFTGGTANRHGRRFFGLAVDACRQLGRPGILLTKYSQNLPDRLPDEVVAADYLPLAKLAPHCAAIVHHGGVGTTSQAFASGTPQVVRPLAYDQFDNAARVEALGCGRWLHRDRDLARVLNDVLDNQAIVNATEEVKQRLVGSQACGEAARRIEAVLQDAQIASQHGCGK